MRTRFAAFGIVIASLLVAPIGVHAQLRGMLKKKADEVLKGKPSAPAPSEPERPTEPTSTSRPTETKPADTRASKAPVSPLETSELGLESKANQALRGEMPVQKGDWDQLPYISQKTIAAAKALDEPARVAFVEKVGAAFKALVMSDAFATSHAAFIKQQHEAVDHGITGLVDPDDAAKKGNYAAITASLQRQSIASYVDVAEQLPPEAIQSELTDELRSWKRNADDPKRKDRAKYQKFVKDAEALLALGSSDPTKLRRGFATLRSADNDGPTTEEAVYALHARVKEETEQLAFDKYNLKGTLKRQLTAFVALVPTVDFDAATTQKRDKLVFVKPAYETKGAAWKACFRAGKAPSQAALAIAQAWLKEL